MRAPNWKSVYARRLWPRKLRRLVFVPLAACQRARAFDRGTLLYLFEVCGLRR
jgi:hypothetical protein